MKYRVISGLELGPDLIERWEELQRANDSLTSPYFNPEFIRSVASVRDDVRIGLMENDNRVFGFFPFQHKKGGVARPVGLGLSDYHGVIADHCTSWTAQELMRGCGLVRWEFDHLLACQPQFVSWHARVSESPIIDISSGFDAFVASRDKSGRKLMREIERKQEKLTERLGPTTFTLHTADPVILRQLMAWKSEQCQRTGTVDYFALDWCRELIERLHTIRTSGFGGLLACLHVGDDVAAVHFAICSNQVWHSWFPAYNHDLEEYSPGLLLLLEMIKAATKQNIKYIDLGKGVSLYKKRFMTGGILVAEGVLEMPSMRNRMHRWQNCFEQWSRKSPLKPFFRIPGRIIKRVERKQKYE
jgi:CelD/BcsL family acetyltransferase involved in cellulose biosynthesis